MTKGTDMTKLREASKQVVREDFPVRGTLPLEKHVAPRYGENPHQSASIYKEVGKNLVELTNLRLVKEGKVPSFNNYMDVSYAMNVLKFFDRPSVAVMKHVVPSGFSTQNADEPLVEVYKKARDADALSAFGGIVVMNTPLDEDTAREIVSTYIEVVAAPAYEGSALEILESKKNIRAFSFSGLEHIPTYVGDRPSHDVRSLPTGELLLQDGFLTRMRSVDDLVTDPLVFHKEEAYLSQREPSSQELRDLLTAWYVNIGTRSNGVVIVKDGTTLAVGTGQQSRIEAVQQAIGRAYRKAMDRAGIDYDAHRWMDYKNELPFNPLKGAVLSSDGFFPFPDCVNECGKFGISAIVQPGGSNKDYLSIEAANKLNISMVFTAERCFGHF